MEVRPRYYAWGTANVVTQDSILPNRVLASREVMTRVARKTRAPSLPLPMRERLGAGRTWVQFQRRWFRLQAVAQARGHHGSGTCRGLVL